MNADYGGLIKAMAKVVGEVKLDCQNPTAGAERPIVATWSYQGKPHQAAFIVSADGIGRPADNVAVVLYRLYLDSGDAAVENYLRS